jgi:ankyrin repeat protein
MRRSSLMMAVRNGNVDIASLLLMKGSEFNLTDSSKNSCVHYAAAYGFPECIDLLILAAADQNAKNSWNLTPLSVALQKNLFGVVKALLNYERTNVNCKDDEGRILVSSSLSKFTADSFEYIKFLILEKNADVTIGDLRGKTPLHYAALLTPGSIAQHYTDWTQNLQRRNGRSKTPTTG